MLGLGTLVLLLSPIRERGPSDTAGQGRTAPASARAAQTAAPMTGAELIQAWRGEGSIRVDDSVGVLVATLPDPVESYQDWMYDTGLEAVRRAFEREGFVLDRFWIPPADSARLRREHPSVLLFRKAAWGLYLLYVVPEIPTSGVYREALTNALDQRDRLLRDAVLGGRPVQANTLRIVGPTFSGSSESLRAAVSAWADAHRGALSSIQVITGSATSPRNREVFAGDDRFWFRATVHSDAQLGMALDSLVLDAGAGLEIEPSEVALITEASTEYGQTFVSPGAAGADAEPGFLLITFPMNIASIRGSYERYLAQELETAPPLAGPESPVALTLEVSERSISPAARSRLTAPTVDVLLGQIVQILEAHEVRLVGLMATDIRDKLFLGQAIKRRLHDVQLFTYESNALFLRSDLTRALHGMLVLTTYPLFFENQRWLQRPGQHEQLVFGNQGSQGVFNATLAQLGDPAAMVEYATPGAIDGTTTPPVWVTVVGDDVVAPIGFLPIVPDTVSPYLLRGPTVYPQVTPHRTTISFAALSAFFAMAIVLLGLGLSELVRTPRRFREFSDDVVRRTLAAPGTDEARRYTPHKSTAPDDSRARRWWRRFTSWAHVPPEHLRLPWPVLRASVQRGSLYLHREIYHGFFLVSLLGVFLPSAALLFADELLAPHPAERSALKVGVIGAIVVFMGLAAVRVAWYGVKVMWRLRREGYELLALRAWGNAKRRWVWRGEVALRVLIVMLGVSYAGLIVSLAFDIILRGADAGSDWWMFFYRAIRVDSGVSPLPPLMITSAGLALWSAWHLRRLALLLERPPFERFVSSRLEETATDEGPPGFWNRLRVRVGAIGDRYGAALKDRWNAAALAVLVAALGALLAYGSSDVSVPWALVIAIVTGIVVATAFALWTSRWTAATEPARTPPLSDQIAEATRGIRDRLFLVVPEDRVWIALIILIVTATWVGSQIGPTFDSQTLAGFKWLFIYGILGTLGSIPWAAVRLVSVWRALERFLDLIGRSPLIATFERLPARVGPLVRLTIFRGNPANVVVPIADVQRTHLANLYLRRQEAFAAADAASGRLTPLIERFAIKTPAHMDARVAELGELETILERAWALEPDPTDIDRFVEAEKKREITEGPDAPATVSWLRRSFTNPTRMWCRAAEEYMALWVVHYVEKVLEQIRRLAIFLLAGLVLATLLLTSYPFHPQSRVKLLFFFVVIGTAAALFFVMMRMGRQEILNRIAKTEPGKIRWDAHFVFNFVLFGAVPLLSLLSAEFPTVRNVFTAIIDPLLGALSSL